jgi:hypothetical protein
VEYSKGFDHHSYLWLENPQAFLKQFLMYSHQLTSEEADIVTAAAANEELQGIEESPPTTKHFKDQVIKLAALHTTHVCRCIRGKICYLGPWLSGHLRNFVSFETDAHFSLVFAFCFCLFTFSSH